MTIFCAPPDGDVGVALRLSGFLDCQARALGENGFQALVGGPMIAGLLTALVTIFVALIGYRFILGTAPDLSDGIGRFARLGLVLALVTGWSAFQTLVYRVSVDGPAELAAVVMPAAGLPNEALDVRVQQAYDTVRLGSNGSVLSAPNGSTNGASPAPTPSATPAPTSVGNPLGQPPLPQTASWFAISTMGVVGALRVAIGFLLAVAPLAILGLLFDATLGLFSGWLRALAGSTLALLAATIVAAIDLLLVEGELAHVQNAELGVGIVDPQGLTTIVLAGSVAMIVAVIMAVRTAGAIRIAAKAGTGGREPGTASPTFLSERQAASRNAAPTVEGSTRSTLLRGQDRTRSVADALVASVRREQSVAGRDEGGAMPGRRVPLSGAARVGDEQMRVMMLGSTGRRMQVRRTRSAARRDGAA